MSATVGVSNRRNVPAKARNGIAALAIAFIVPLSATAGSDDDRTDLYAVDLETGATELVAYVDDDSIDGMAVTADGTAYLLSDDDLITITLPTDASGAGIAPDATVPITGLGDDDLVGIDVRPASGELFAISKDSVVYRIDPETGEATAPGEALDPALADDALGFDFDPTVDRIRVAVSTGQNLRLNPDTGAVGTNPDTGAATVDGDIAYAEGDDNAANSPAVVGAGYTNSVAGAEETQLYVIDARQDVLALQDPPNDGTLNTVGALGVDVDGSSAFDITPDGDAFLTVSADDDDDDFSGDDD